MISTTTKLILSKDAETILTYLIGTKSQIPERHKRVIRETCHLTEGARAEKALKELMDARLVTDSGESLVELTAAGREKAIEIQKSNQAPTSVTTMQTTIEKVEGGTIKLAGGQDLFSTPTNDDLPLKLRSEGIVAPPSSRRRPAKLDDSPIEVTAERVKTNLPTLVTHPLRNGMPEHSTGRGSAAKPPRPKAIAARFMLAFDTQKDALPVPVVNGDVLGRGKTCTIIMKHDEYLSNRHCRFEIMRDKTTNRPTLYVEDLGSRNGTLVDEYDISGGKAQLYHGSRLQIGETVLVVVEIPY